MCLRLEKKKGGRGLTFASVAASATENTRHGSLQRPPNAQRVKHHPQQLHARKENSY